MHPAAFLSRALPAFLVLLSVLAAVPGARAGCPPIDMPEDPPTYLTEWGSLGSGNDQFNSPNGVAIDSQGNVWVPDRWNNRVKKFAPDGTWLDTYCTGYGTGDYQLIAPAQVAFDADDNWYVTERHRVKMYDYTGTFIRKFGTEGTGDGELSIPDGIDVAPDGNVYVVDHDNSRVQVFTPEGVYLHQFTHPQMFHPHGIAIADDGDVYISGGGQARVLKFDLDGNYIFHWGSYVTSCPEGGDFNHVVGLGLDSNQNLYVVDAYNTRVQKFDSMEMFLCLWGTEGAGPGQFSLSDDGPGHVAVADDGTIYVADTGNNRIQAFSTGTTSAIEPASSSWSHIKAAFREE